MIRGQYCFVYSFGLLVQFRKKKTRKSRYILGRKQTRKVPKLYSLGVFFLFELVSTFGIFVCCIFVFPTINEDLLSVCNLEWVFIYLANVDRNSLAMNKIGSGWDREDPPLEWVKHISACSLNAPQTHHGKKNRHTYLCSCQGQFKVILNCNGPRK